jgi:hypothetical protein
MLLDRQNHRQGKLLRPGKESRPTASGQLTATRSRRSLTTLIQDVTPMKISIWVFVAGAAAGLAGCERAETISQYTVPRADQIQLPAPQTEGGASNEPAATAGRPERMLGAIVSQKDQTWFFKLTGPIPDVTAEEPRFTRFCQSIDFSQGNSPTWELPAGWSQSPGSGMRFATITVSPGPPPVEMTVIPLPTGAAPYEQQLLENVNRWRGQLSLPPQTAVELSQAKEELKSKDGSTVTIVRLTGTASGRGMGGGALAGGMGGPFSGPAAGGSARPASSSTADPSEPGGNAAPAAPPVSISYDTPDGWKEGTVGGLRKAAFEVIADGRRVETTVIDLPIAAGDRLANINRWRGQVGLSPLTADTLPAAITPIEVGPLKGDFVEIVGDPNAARPQTILGVIVDHDAFTWFVKLQGDSELAAQQKESFQQFARSLRFEPNKAP